MTNSLATCADAKIGDKVLISNDLANGVLASASLTMAVIRGLENDFVDLEFSDGTVTAIPLNVFNSGISIPI